MKSGKASNQRSALVFVIGILAAPACAELLDAAHQRGGSDPGSSRSATPGNALYGFVPLSYDMTVEAIDETDRVAEQNGTLNNEHVK